MVQCFENLADPRSTINRYHLLVDIIAISICAVVAGADGPTAIEEWAKRKKDWLKKHLRLPHGIPSHDTIGRVLQVLQPQAFQECFAAWLTSLAAASDSNEPIHLAIDGKALRRSHDTRRGLGPLYLVSAWATEQGVSMGQVATEEKSNEITAIPRLLDQLELAGTVITIDAAGCQRNIARQIIDGRGDYVLALKANQPTMYEDVEKYFEEQMANNFAGVRVSSWEEHDVRHGREEERYYYQLSVPSSVRNRKQWAGLKTIGMALRVAKENGKVTTDVRYYLSSLRRSGRRFARFVRGHWGIETTLHWSLDMTFREDESRLRERHLTENIAWLRRLALTLLKQHPYKQSLAMKRRIAGWDVDFLIEVLTGQTT
jgi:predicted transposase YbfD/YdcC